MCFIVNEQWILMIFFYFTFFFLFLVIIYYYYKSQHKKTAGNTYTYTHQVILLYGFFVLSIFHKKYKGIIRGTIIGILSLCEICVWIKYVIFFNVTRTRWQVLVLLHIFFCFFLAPLKLYQKHTSTIIINFYLLHKNVHIYFIYFKYK